MDSLTINAAGNQIVELGNRNTANFNVYRMETITANAAATNTLIADNTANTWIINVANGGTVADGTTTTQFANFNNLTGGSAADTITLSTGTVSGLIDGAAGNDSLTITTAGDMTVELGNRATANLNVYQMESITANGAAVNTLIADNTANVWAITGNNSGTVADGTTTTAFANFNNLTGGSAADTMTLSAGTITGLIDGAGGNDSLTITAAGNQTVELGNRTTANLNVYRMELIMANAAAVNTLLADNTGNTWNITGTNSGAVADGTTTTTFTNFNNLTGGSGVDNFTLLAGTVTGLIDGAGGNDSLTITAAGNQTVELGNRSTANLNVYQLETITANITATNTLIGDNTANTWLITGNNSGNVYDGTTTTTFANFQNLSGGSLVDQFTVNAGAGVTSITGGLGNDIFTINGAVTTLHADIANDIVAGDADTVTVNAGSVVGTINLGGGNDQFTVNGGTVAVVNGDAGNDTFTVAGGTVNTITGGAGTDFVGYTGNNVSITVGLNIGDGLEGVNAVNGNGTLTARNGVTSTWTIDGINAGNVFDSSNPAQVLAFSGFSTLNGGTGVDIFNITRNTMNNTNGQTTTAGVFNGNGGNDQLNIALTGLETGLVNFIGGAGTDTVTITGNTTYTTAVYTPTSTGGYDQIVATVAAGGNAYSVNYQQAETVASSLSVGTLTVNGTNNTDNIQLGNGTFAVSATPVVYSNVTNVAVNALLGNADTINVNNVNLGAGTLTLIGADSVTGTTLTAGTLLLDTVGQFGTAVNPITTTLTTLQMVSTGPVYINETADLDINTTGVVTNTGIFTIAGTTTIDAGNGSLTLDNPLNNFDIVNVSNTDAITLFDRNSINGGTITANSVTLQTADGIGQLATPLQTQTANLTVTNTTTGGVYITNNQSVTVGITNVDDIRLTNTTGDVTVERLYTNGGNYGSTATVPYAGSIVISVPNGAVNAYAGLGSHSAGAAPDIVAENLDVSIRGDFGTPGRFMSLRVHNRFSFFGARGYVFYFDGRPLDVIGAQDLVVFSGLAGLSNQQLVEVESLAEVDPAIFTEVRNYFYEDLAIKMPPDQLYAEDDEKEKKRYLNKEETVQ